MYQVLFQALGIQLNTTDHTPTSEQVCLLAQGHPIYKGQGQRGGLSVQLQLGLEQSP